MSTEIDLDALESEGRPGPMTIKVKGKKFETIDPMLLPWSKFRETDWDSTDEILKAVLAKDYQAIIDLDLTLHAMNILGEQLTKHYFGVTEGE